MIISNKLVRRCSAVRPLHILVTMLVGFVVPSAIIMLGNTDVYEAASDAGDSVPSEGASDGNFVSFMGGIFGVDVVVMAATDVEALGTELGAPVRMAGELVRDSEGAGDSTVGVNVVAMMASLVVVEPYSVKKVVSCSVTVKLGLVEVALASSVASVVTSSVTVVNSSVVCTDFSIVVVVASKGLVELVSVAMTAEAVVVLGSTLDVPVLVVGSGDDDGISEDVADVTCDNIVGLEVSVTCASDVGNRLGVAGDAKISVGSRLDS